MSCDVTCTGPGMGTSENFGNSGVLGSLLGGRVHSPHCQSNTTRITFLIMQISSPSQNAYASSNDLFRTLRSHEIIFPFFSGDRYHQHTWVSAPSRSTGTTLNRLNGMKCP